MAHPVQLIVRLPYNRPLDGSSANPAPIQWTSENEQLFWEVISQSRGREGTSIDWPALAAHLRVPLPYLLYRAGKRFEERLRDLHEVKANVSSPDPALNADPAKPESRPTNVLLRRLSNQNTASGAGRSSPLPSSPKAGTTRLASSACQSTALHARGASSSSIVTIPPRGGPLFFPTASTRHIPPIPSVSSSSSSDEAEDAEEEDQRQMEKDEASRRIRELDRLVNRDTLQFYPPPRSAVSPPPRQARATIARHPRSEASSSIHADRSVQSTSTSPGSPLSAASQPQVFPPRREEIQSSPSPPPTSTSFSRGRPSQRQSVVDKTGVNGRSSTAASTSSSFSDISDVSTSALEEAVGSTFRGAGTSRLSMFARNHLGRQY